MLLWRYYEKITIPKAVWEELEELDGTPAFETLQDALADGRIVMCEQQNSALTTLLLESLDRGEAEAISLAHVLRADLLLMDEHDGRAAAERLGITITGVLGILRRAKLEGVIASLSAEIARLRHVAHFFVSPHLERALLNSVGEMP